MFQFVEEQHYLLFLHQSEHVTVRWDLWQLESVLPCTVVVDLRHLFCHVPSSLVDGVH